MKHPTKDIEKRIAVVGCKHTTKDLIIGLDREGFKVDHCITIDPDKGASQKVAGYMDLRPFLEERAIEYTVAQNYSLKDDADRQSILAQDLDAILVMGWQRLIPNWFLENLSIGAFGMHGSSKPLPHGRGRSPMNWSLIQGKSKFYTHLFQYLPGVDDGPVVGVQIFDINQIDTALTLHFKNTVSMTKLCIEHLPALLDGSVRMIQQSKKGATYYPKRSREDGLIYWQDRTEDIYNLIRAVTHPFPGAFSYIRGSKEKEILVWKAQPFDTRLKYDAQPGDVVEVFYNGNFVVKTGDGTLLVTEYEGYKLGAANVGMSLDAASLPRKEWENLPE